VKPFNRRSFLVALVLISPFACAQRNDVFCDPGGINSTNRQEGTVQMKAFNFIWSSHWNEINIGPSQAGQQSRYCVCVEVRNKSHEPLYYEWQVPARLHNEGLPDSNGDRVCEAANKYAYPPEDHDIYFGRSGDKVRTSIWELVREYRERTDRQTIRPDNKGGGIYEDVAPAPDRYPLEPIAVSVDLHSVVFHKRRYLLFVPLPRKSERVDVRLAIRSEVTSNETGYSIHNDIKNLIPDNAVFLNEVALHPVTTSSGRHKRAGGGTAPVVGPGYGWADFWKFLRTHLWPVPLPPARANFYQPEISGQTMESRLRPELETRKIDITSPRSLQSLSFKVEVWVPGVNREEQKANGK
jgi:hypothetical protein